MTKPITIPNYVEKLQKVLDDHYMQLVGLDVAIRTGERLLIGTKNAADIQKKISQLKQRREATYRTIDVIIDLIAENTDAPKE